MLAEAEKFEEDRERSGQAPQMVGDGFAGTFRGITCGVKDEGEGGHKEDSFSFQFKHLVDVGKPRGEGLEWGMGSQVQASMQ